MIQDDENDGVARYFHNYDRDDVAWSLCDANNDDIAG